MYTFPSSLCNNESKWNKSPRWFMWSVLTDTWTASQCIATVFIWLLRSVLGRRLYMRKHGKKLPSKKSMYQFILSLSLPCSISHHFSKKHKDICFLECRHTGVITSIKFIYLQVFHPECKIWKHEGKWASL